MAARKKLPAPPPPPAEPPRERFVPPWTHNRYSDVQHGTQSLAALVRDVQDGCVRLPRFQRGWVWTDDQVIRLFNSFLRGFHVGSLLLWERWNLPTSTERFGEITVESRREERTVLLVVDGQQRIGSVVTAALSKRFFFDLQDGSLTTGDGPWRVPAAHFLTRGGTGTNVRWPKAHAAEHGLSEDKVWDYWCEMSEIVGRIYISSVRLGNDWNMARVMETFRRLNTEGTPMDPADLEEGLRRAQGL